MTCWLIQAVIGILNPAKLGIFQDQMTQPHRYCIKVFQTNTMNKIRIHAQQFGLCAVLLRWFLTDLHPAVNMQPVVIVKMSFILNTGL